MTTKTVQELIDLLQKIEDKTQEICVWNELGYYGSDLDVEYYACQDGKPLMIVTNE